MPDDKTTGPESNLAKFVREMSEAADRLEEFDDFPDRVMDEAGLTEDEKEIVRRGDEAEIMRAIGQVPEHGAVLTIRVPRIRFRRRRPPTGPTTVA